MAAMAEVEQLSFPELPAQHKDFIAYTKAHPEKPLLDLLEPYKQYDAELRKAFATQPDHPNVAIPNVLSVFEGNEKDLKVRARELDNETEKVKESYIMPLKPEDRKASGSPAIVDSLAKFKEQFSLFSESALSDLDWSNVVAAGSSVVTPLLPIPDKYNGSKRSMRQFYHEVFAPASDVDLFLYGLDEQQAIEKIKQIERNIKDALLVETTTIRTKNAITIASQYPTRHIQIVLRVYKSISEILTGFDVDCSCAAFDGEKVWANPRALTSFMTQVNTIDLSRRSPSYESRLSKYHHRGFEVYWPDLDRSRIDPTIYERSFLRTEGLARLLVMEKLPTNDAREAYLDQRRKERGRPAANRTRRQRHKLLDDIKADHEDEVADWVDSEEVSSYHTFTIPYGPKYHAHKIERLIYTKDLLLNSEWNIKDREVNLHRHPAFIGSVEDVITDCCGFCPQPTTMEEEEVYENESKIYVSGDLTFIKDDPGRQTIGSFNPLTADDYTEMAYVGNTEMLCRAIVDGDVQFIESWLTQDGNDPNSRDYTGRAPLHLAASSSTAEVVQLLVDHGARLVARLADGRTALHLACMRGDIEMVKVLLKKSAANEEEEEEKIDARRRAHAAKNTQPVEDTENNSEDGDDSDIDMVDSDEGMTDVDATTEASMVNIKSLSLQDDAVASDDKDEPDFYDINVLAWDVAVSPLHLAIVKGHIEVVKLLVSEYGADILLPVKLFEHDPHTSTVAILTLVLAMQLPEEKAIELSKLLFDLGATCSQADLEHRTAFHVAAVTAPHLLDTYVAANETGVKRSINHCSVSGSSWYPSVSSPLMSAIQAWDSVAALRLLGLGARPSISFAAYTKAAHSVHKDHQYYDAANEKRQYETNFSQPIVSAIDLEQPELALALIREHDVDINTLGSTGHQVISNEWCRSHTKGTTILDCVKAKVQELREWRAVDTRKPPKPLKSNAEYLATYKEGTYQLWSAEHQLAAATKRYNAEAATYAEAQKIFDKQEGKEEKQAAIFELLDKYRELEAVMLKRGAKLFSELHPEIPTPVENPRNQYHYPLYNQFEKPVVSFEVRGITDDIAQRYAELFDASWQGDVEKVKEYVLSPWTDSENNKQPPCRIAVQDKQGVSPFAIAMMRGHLELAKIILDFAKAQYSPDADNNPVKKRVRIKGQGDDGDDDCDSYDSDDEDDDADSDDVKLETDIIEDKFTIDNVGEVIISVKTTISPHQMMTWRSLGLQYYDRKGVKSKADTAGFNKRTNTGSRKVLKEMVEEEENQLAPPTNLVQWAMWQEDFDALKLLLQYQHEYVVEASEKTENRYKPVPLYADFKYAIRLDRPQYLAEIIKHTGLGIPLDSFVKKSDVESNERSKYYQGLSIKGKKKKEWAMRGREVPERKVQDIRPPLLVAAYCSALECVEWLQTDAPLRCYKQYAEAYMDDGRLQHLEQFKGGFDKMVRDFLSLRSELAIHCSLLAQASPRWDTFEFLVKHMPDTIDHKNEDGLTPLHIAFKNSQVEEARFLIKHGANQTARTKNGRNIVHLLLAGAYRKDDNARGELRRMLDLIDKRVLPSLMVERSAASDGTMTPFASWVNGVSESKDEGTTAALIMEYSHGAELDLIDGSGHTPLHTAVARHNYAVVELLTQINPTLVFREDATGRTPFEVVEDEVLSGVFQPPRFTQSHHDRNHEARTRGVYRRERGLVGIKLIHQDSEDFIKDPATVAPSLSRIWNYLQEFKTNYAKDHTKMRTLVTLNEANEVARRLAAIQVKPLTRGYSNYYKEQQELREKQLLQDEVAVWMSSPTFGDSLFD